MNIFLYVILLNSSIYLFFVHTDICVAWGNYYPQIFESAFYGVQNGPLATANLWAQDFYIKYI